MSEVDELKKTFTLRWEADQRAIKKWQQMHPGNDLVWPDHADLVVWLLGRLENVTERLRRHAFSVCRDTQSGKLKYTHCDECDTRWMADQPEAHKPGCTFHQPPAV